VQKTVLANWLPAGAPPANTTRALPRLPAAIQTPMTVKQLEAQLAGAPAPENTVPVIEDYGPVATPTKMEMMRKRVVEHAAADPETVARLVRVWVTDERNK
jgi:flagellar biosynthesis/type III secretory pathway M-ring protein FliF/YscJ